MKTSLLFIAVLFSITGCSTFKSVFSGGTSEDYNKLTYGDQHPNWSARTPVESPRESSDANADDTGSKRTVASATQDAEAGEELDPTDENVRGKIETQRGVYVSKYSHGDRATRSDFYDQAPGDGSLWSSENDANYFYTKNKMRAIGDVISIKIEDPMVKHIAEEVKKSLTPPEQEVEMALYLKNSAGAKDDKDLEAYKNVVNSDLKADAEDVKVKMEKSVRWSQVDLSKSIGLAPNEELRAEIIDRFQNGNYKIRTVKRVLYRGSSKLVSLVAVAPSADFDDKDLINSGKLYEYKIRVAR